MNSFPKLPAVVDRRALLSLGGLAFATPKWLWAQSRPSPNLSAPSEDVRRALDPLAARGAAIWIDDLDAGASAKTTVLCRMPASVAQVRQVIASPQLYPEFLSVVRDVVIDSSRGTQTGFHFRAVASIFELNVAAAMRSAGPRRVDVNIVRSDFGPGAARWELFEAGPDSTLVACSTWGDPSQGHWLFRQVARRGNASIALMTTAVNLLLSLSLQKRVSTLVSRPIVAEDRSNEPLTPISAALRSALPTGVLGSVTLSPQGTLLQSSTSYMVNVSLARVEQALRNVAQYGTIWRAMRNVRVLGTDADQSIRFASELESSLARSAGSRRLTITRTDQTLTAQWVGIGGDELGHSLRWDAVAQGPSQVVLMATIGDESSRIGFPFRRTIDGEPALRSGLALGLASVWARSLSNFLTREALGLPAISSSR